MLDLRSQDLKENSSGETKHVPHFRAMQQLEDFSRLCGAGGIVTILFLVQRQLT